jgi:hypothetical protein
VVFFYFLFGRTGALRRQVFAQSLRFFAEPFGVRL